MSRREVLTGSLSTTAIGSPLRSGGTISVKHKWRGSEWGFASDRRGLHWPATRSKVFRKLCSTCAGASIGNFVSGSALKLRSLAPDGHKGISTELRRR